MKYIYYSQITAPLHIWIRLNFEWGYFLGYNSLERLHLMILDAKAYFFPKNFFIFYKKI